MAYRYRKAKREQEFKDIGEATPADIHGLTEALTNRVLDRIESGQVRTIYTIGGYDIEVSDDVRFDQVRNEILIMLRRCARELT